MAHQQQNSNQLMPLSSGSSSREYRGGLFSPTTRLLPSPSPSSRMEYSAGTLAAVRELSRSSRLSHKQNEALLSVLRSGGSLPQPPMSSSSSGGGYGKLEHRATYIKRRQLHGREIGLELGTGGGGGVKLQPACASSPFQHPLRRSYSSILASGDLQPVRFRGTAPSVSHDSAKAQLALRMELGHNPPQPAAVPSVAKAKVSSSIDELKEERLTELTEALHSRLSFLHEMHGFGVHEHDDYINNQLGEIRKEMEELKLGGSSSSAEAAADF